MTEERLSIIESASSKAAARISGLNLDLRLIEPNDAEYLYGLRTDPALNPFLSEVHGTAADQRRWIESYKAREALGREAYYVIERRGDLEPCGVVRLYNIEPDRFTWGSWILASNKPPKAALESALLSFAVGFDTFDKHIALIDVRRNNQRALQFYRRFGMEEKSSTEIDIYFELTRDQFCRERQKLWRIIETSIVQQ